MTTQHRSGRHGAVTIPGLEADSCFWDGTDRTGSRQPCCRQGVTSFKSFPSNSCYWKEVVEEDPFGLAPNIFGDLSPSREGTGYQHVKYIHRELLSHQDFTYVPFIHLEIFPEQKNRV